VTWLGWCLVTLGLALWAVGARGFVDELAEFLRGDRPQGGSPRPGPPDDDQVDQLGGADPGPPAGVGGGH
jgi:hypothetical protein